MPADDKRRALSRPDALWTAFSGACLAVHFGAWVASLKLTTLAHSLLLVSMGPVLIVLLALARRAPVSRGELGGTLLALAGAAALAAGAAAAAAAGGQNQQQQQRQQQRATVGGDALAFLAAAAVVGYLEVGARLRAYQPAFVYAAPVTGLAAALLTLAALGEEALRGGGGGGGGGGAGGALFGMLFGHGGGSGGSGARYGAFGWVASAAYAPYVIWLGTVSGIVGHTGFNTLLRHLSPLTVSLAIQLEPLFGSLIGWALGVATAPGAATWAGGAAVLAATAVVLVAAARRQAGEAAAAAAGRARRARSGAAAGDGDASGGAGGGGWRLGGRDWPDDGDDDGGGGSGGGGGVLQFESDDDDDEALALSPRSRGRRPHPEAVGLLQPERSQR